MDEERERMVGVDTYVKEGGKGIDGAFGVSGVRVE